MGLRLAFCSSALATGQPYLRWLCFFVRTTRQDDVRRLAGACRLLSSTASSSGVQFFHDNMQAPTFVLVECGLNAARIRRLVAKGIGGKFCN